MIKKQQIISFGLIISLFGIKNLTGMVISPEQRQVHDNFKQIICDVLTKEQNLLTNMAETSPLIQRSLALHNRLQGLNLQGIHFPMQLDVIKRISQNCMICKKLFEEDDVIIFSDLDTNCPHLYHSDCILHAQLYHKADCSSCRKRISYTPQKLLLVDMKIDQQDLEPLYQNLVCKHRDMGCQEPLLDFRKDTIGLAALMSSSFFLNIKNAGWSSENILGFTFCQSFIIVLLESSLFAIDSLLYERPDLLRMNDPLLLILLLTIVCFNTYDRFFPECELIIGIFILSIIGQAALKMVRFVPTIIEHYQKVYYYSCVKWFKNPAYFALFPINQQFVEQCHHFTKEQE